ncbi:hypothetical protein [Cyclobacterium sp.]|uniref:hypothetical protein n=1 Tax=Cyclobacterium sp. TaxID=1966343 RepID=UPI0019ABBDF0|nr:hypothetical protein [Cyclobacterium sp.]MBD3627067.1 hypothetical protein [Cyclobacterium sp.]
MAAAKAGNSSEFLPGLTGNSAQKVFANSYFRYQAPCISGFPENSTWEKLVTFSNSKQVVGEILLFLIT